VLVDATNEEAAAFYQHFDFHELEGHRFCRRLNDVARAVGID
jgi:hypothetical protein